MRLPFNQLKVAELYFKGFIFNFVFTGHSNKVVIVSPQRVKTLFSFSDTQIF